MFSSRRTPTGICAAVVLTTAVLITGARPGLAETPPEAACDEKAVPTTQLRCYLDAAEAAGEPGICERAKEMAVRFNCLALYAERSGDTAPCLRIEAVDDEAQALRDSCISGVAVARQDPGLCAQADLQVVRDSCIMTLVVQHGADPGLCAQIENPTLKSACSE